MRRVPFWMTAGVLSFLLPALASAQTSTIAGEVKDTSGGVLPGVTVEAASPALIEKVRTAVTDGAGRYSIGQLRPGIYSVTFTLAGFTTVKREGIELTSDFTAAINAELKVSSISETITVTAESPVVDVQGTAQRTVMTREVLDVLPTGRNIQTAGILIPGTSISVGGGGAISRDVGGSGQLQQSPLQFRGAADSVQTVEGMRLNNLCGAGQYSGVYWNDGSFEELSYTTGVDSPEMAQGGIRINMVPRDGGNTFRGTWFTNYTRKSWTSDNVSADSLAGDLTFNKNNRLNNVTRSKRIWDVNPSIGGPIFKDRLWFNFTYRNWGTDKIVGDSFFDADPSPFRFVPDTSRPGVDDGDIRSYAARVAFQLSQKDKITSYHDDQFKDRGHWGISIVVQPEAAGVQVTPTSYVSVHKWTRTQTSRLVFDAGFAIYKQEFTELLQPSALNGFEDTVFDLDQIRKSNVFSIFDQSTNKIANAWPNPADHFSTLRTYSGSASYVTGSHSFKVGTQVSEGTWKLIQARTGDVSEIRFNNGVPVSATLQIPTERNNEIRNDLGIFAADRWSLGRATFNLGVRYDWFVGKANEGEALASRFSAAQIFPACPDGKNNQEAGCAGQVQNWKDLSPRLGFALDVFGDGRTAVKSSIARYVGGEVIATVNTNNPITSLGLTDTRRWSDLDGNGLPFNPDGTPQLNELTPSSNTPNFGRNVVTTTSDPKILNGWWDRPFNWEYAVSVQHQIAPRMSVNGGYFLRWFGNQRVTDDLRFDNSDYDGPFCVNVPVNPNLPGGGGGQVCNLFELKPSSLAAGRPQQFLIRRADDFGGVVDRFQGFDVNVDGRFSNGAFLRGGIQAQRRMLNECDLLVVDSPNNPLFPDGDDFCSRVFPFKPDIKISGAYTLPLDVQVSGTFQFVQGIQNAGSETSLQANWPMTNSLLAANSTLGRPLAGSSFKTVPLIRPGDDFGDEDLQQLDLRFAKRFRFGRYRVRVNADIFNVFNDNWPFTLNNTFSNTATSAWLRPTNTLQGRMFKLGGQFDF